MSRSSLRVFVAGANEPWQNALFDALSNRCEVIHLRPIVSRAGWFPHAANQASCVLPRGSFSHRRWLAKGLSTVSEERILKHYGSADALILTDPYHWPLAKYYGKIASILAYHVSDDYWSYPAVRRDLEAVIVEQARLIFPVSRRLASLLHERYNADNTKMFITPNGVPASWVPPSCPSQPRALPELIPQWFRPLVGIIGVISDRVDLAPIIAAHDALPQLYWVFVGPVLRNVQGLDYLRNSPRCCFTGELSYKHLQAYFSALDASVLPLTNTSINPGSSPVRFFSQLPTGQPIVYLGCCDQLEEEPNLTYRCEDADQLISTLSDLYHQGFRDGRHHDRHRYAQQCTWSHRASVIADSLARARSAM